MRSGVSDQLGVQCDRGVEHLGDWAILLGIACHSSKRGFVQVRHFGAQGQSGPTDAESLALWLESDRRLGSELRGRIAGGLKPKGQCHGEAAGMGGSDQLFGIGALLVLETRSERIGSLSEHAGIGGKIAVAGATSAAPNRFRLADHVTSPCYGVFRTLSSLISSFVGIVTVVRSCRLLQCCSVDRRLSQPLTG